MMTQAILPLSTAMMLGDTLRQRDHATYLTLSDSGWCGCALGGAQLANGRTDCFAFLQLWPWLRDDDLSQPDGRWAYWQTINYKFAEVAARVITFEQLVDWVRSVEPKREGDVAEVEQPTLFGALSSAMSEE